MTVTAIQINKVQRTALKFIAKAVHNYDDRSALQCVDFTSAVAVSCNGHRLHAVPNPVEHVGVSKMEVNQESVVISDQDETYPDWSQILPTGDPKMVFRINRKYLLDALQGLSGDDAVTISLYKDLFANQGINTSHIEVRGYTAEELPGYALIMPMMDDPNNRYNWTPK